MTERQYCTRCLYYDEMPDVEFDEEGVCNYCKIYDKLEKEHPTGKEGWKKLEEIAEKIKKDGKGKKYDCVVGVSGGCDSTYLLYVAKEKLGLRPLAVHFDNTWNSKIAVENIHNALKNLDIDLFTYVMDNEEFNDISRSFLRASVPEVDAPTDVALAATLYIAAEKHGIKYILNGHNFRTEGPTPLGWFYFDGKYVSDIHNKFGEMKMERFPNLWFSRWMKWVLKGIKRIRPLYYLEYDKEKVKKMLSKELDWQWYGGHHQENRFTFFNHRYILPKKFDRDLRYVEFSAHIRSGQMERKEALEKISTPPICPDNIVEEIKKRLKISDEEFNDIMELETKSAKDYKTYHPLFKKLRPMFWLMMKANLVPKSFYIKYTK